MSGCLAPRFVATTRRLHRHAASFLLDVRSTRRGDAKAIHLAKLEGESCIIKQQQLSDGSLVELQPCMAQAYRPFCIT